MKLMRLAMCVAVFALVGGIAMAEDMDVRALQAKLAAQEARLNDLQAKMNSAGDDGKVADGITSLRKNAVVTLGGTVNTRYFARSGEVKSSLGTETQYAYEDAANPGQVLWDPSDTLAGATALLDEAGEQITANAVTRAARRKKIADHKSGDLRLSDAKLEAKIDVNEYFDAYLKLDFHDGAGRSDVSGIAQNYWIRWKNVCNSGFGVIVGRDSFKFGGTQPIGILDSWNKDFGGSANDIWVGALPAAAYTYTDGTTYTTDGGVTTITGAANTAYGEGMLTYNNTPARTTWNFTRTTQINPYWENQDGSFKAELSLIQSIDSQNYGTNRYTYTSGSTTKYRSQNYGFGSGSFRITWKPVEGLKLAASVMNLYSSANKVGSTFQTSGIGNQSGNATENGTRIRNYGVRTAKNHTGVNLAFEYRPCFFNKLNVWASYTHGWNTNWVKDMDDDTLNYGFSYDINDRTKFFAQGDFLRTKNDQGNIWNKATGWASYVGLQYNLPYGVNTEIGWRHDQFKYKDRDGNVHTKFTGDTFYAHLGFNF